MIGNFFRIKFHRFRMFWVSRHHGDHIKELTPRNNEDPIERHLCTIVPWCSKGFKRHQSIRRLVLRKVFWQGYFSILVKIALESCPSTCRIAGSCVFKKIEPSFELPPFYAYFDKDNKLCLPVKMCPFFSAVKTRFNISFLAENFFEFN